MPFLPYGRQWIDSDDEEAVVSVLRSEFLTTGPVVAEFESAVADYCGARFAVAVSSGTAALHIASLALLKPGEKVLTTPNSFLATANAILYAGAVPRFVDIGPDGNIDLELCEEMLGSDTSIGALYVVHFSGNPVDQGALARLKKKYGVTILEDCAHSIGAEYNGIKAGSCTHSDASIFSFHPVKHMTAGEGGMVTTNDETLWETMKILRNHGMVKTPDMKPWEYEMRMLGYNYRITDIQCALGLSQLGKLDDFIARRRELAKRYDEAFEHHPAIRPLYRFNGRSSYHLYVVRIDFRAVPLSREELFVKMREEGIGLQVHYMPINRQPYYRRLGYGGEKTPEMDRYYAECVSLPLYPKLGDSEQSRVVETLKGLLNG